MHTLLPIFTHCCVSHRLTALGCLTHSIFLSLSLTHTPLSDTTHSISLTLVPTHLSLLLSHTLGDCLSHPHMFSLTLTVSL